MVPETRFGLAGKIKKMASQTILNDRFVKLLLESLGDGVFTLDPDGRITSWNPAMERITGYSPEEAIGKREDGIVIMAYNLCTGCQACVEACPYDAIGFDEDKTVAQKCNLCYHRVDQELIPACADNICPAHCIYFKY